MALCFIGNSHLAAVKLGWEAFATAKDAVEPAFFGSARNTLLHTRIEAGRLVPTDDVVERNFRSSAGQDAVPLSDFDGFVLIGSTLGLRSLVALSALHARFGEGADTRFLASRAAIDAACHDLLFHSACGHVARLLVSTTDKPVWMVDRPQPSEELLASDHPQAAAYRDMASGEARDRLEAMLQRWRASAEAEGMRTLAQPAETLVDGWLTRQEFATGAKGIDGRKAYDAEDHFHMNARYGAELLRAIWPVVSESAQATPEPVTA
ncbi:hypothetical protein PSA7680_00284 [Pseudoruegeria aquimaris]|uniref:SGNH hydrolase-type esterase domain-containing protein n=1 Tax=Pseudoruegeria aquimaris TaxID=393663 RepID=A0A1Y5RCL0_9RHOB|nr:hypothetical protein [Pseudoruegeria aquimaris]SLN13978.1 hypothetical protein PSA7680_00284 [Pseudoruegeria aquimaris]